MGKSVRSRSRLPSPDAASAAAAVEVQTPGRMPSGTRCRASSWVVLLLSAAFGLAMVAVLFLTLRPGHSKPGGTSKTGPQERRAGSRGVDGLRVYGYEIVRDFDHDPSAFTQGLAFAGNGTLYESTGLIGKSSVREVDLETGKVRQKRELNGRDFGEGLTIWKDRLLQVVWKEKKVYIYDKETLVPQGELSHHMQDGWGLTSTDDQIIGSDGTSKLYFMDPDTFREVRAVTVKDGDKEVGWLNELEFVGDEIWANVWQGECIARISPKRGKVTGWILLHSLRNQLLSSSNQVIDVLNGIAWDREGNKLYVTGKLWPKLYEIRLVDKTRSSKPYLEAIRKACNIGQEGFQ